ncbi:hypothetical protein CY34DRAFT_797468 [Suillus luteus UH-Slu-Lm8-n1]|uniref:Uncharacterized protein n=1 Tax=Suillus luteus UH-Slu-Lm8-n1 TaxID=930992 RepID=A0A0D0B4V8_9AGAM|nr:hypothetical protein CY34DRAFT_797468 [Suillus luteus UH-Slu-Lm8-n1]
MDCVNTFPIRLASTAPLHVVSYAASLTDETYQDTTQLSRLTEILEGQTGQKQMHFERTRMYINSFRDYAGLGENR